MKSRHPRAGECWIRNDGGLVYFKANINGVLLGTWTDRGANINKKSIQGTYCQDWTWYNKTGKWDYVNNPPNELDCAKFLCRLN